MVCIMVYNKSLLTNVYKSRFIFHMSQAASQSIAMKTAEGVIINGEPSKEGAPKESTGVFVMHVNPMTRGAIQLKISIQLKIFDIWIWSLFSAVYP